MSFMIEENISLKSFNTFGIDVSARWFASFKNTEDLSELLQYHHTQKQKLLILGGGSNILLTGNFNGLVIRNELKGIDLVGEDSEFFFVRAQAGENWHSFVMDCISNNRSGIENLSLIPGSVGASPMQNIGAYGVEIKDVFESLEAIHISERRTKTFNASECSFGYRESVFKRHEKDQWIILSVTFRLRKKPVFQTTYGAIEEELERMNKDQITIRDISQAVINIRSSKLPDPAHLGNAGSFFKNPVVSDELYQQIKQVYPEVPGYVVSGTEIKIPAGWLIEKAGWKGKQVGKCGVHNRQALVIVNYGGASGHEIFELSSTIIEDVLDKFGVPLEREVNII